MPLHRLTRVTIGVPNLAETAAYYEDFGLTPAGPSADGRPPPSPPPTAASSLSWLPPAAAGFSSSVSESTTPMT